MKELYHYCSAEKAFNILKSRTIIMSDIEKTNDYRELSLFFPKIFDYIEFLYMQKPFRLKYDLKVNEEALMEILDVSYRYWRKRFESGEFSNYVLCFSEVQDSLSQWRGYANNANGYCLGFDFEEIISYCNKTNGVIRLEQVTYLEEIGIDKVIRDAAKDILYELKGLRKWIATNMTHDDKEPDTDGLMLFYFDGMLEKVFTESLKYKSYDFHEEREWRMFFSHPVCKESHNILKITRKFEKNALFLRDKIDFQVTDNDIISFCPIDFDEFSDTMLTSICIGPENRTREQDMKLFLKSNGYEKAEIRFSKVSYQ